MDASRVELVPTGRGLSSVWHDDIEYIYNMSYGKKSYWRCSSRSVKNVRCGAILHTCLGGTSGFYLSQPHSVKCEYIVGAREAKKAIAKVKEIAVTTTEKPRSIATRVDATLPTRVAVLLPLKRDLCRAVRRVRVDDEGVPMKQKTLSSIRTDGKMAINSSEPDETVVQFDTGPEDVNRMIIFGTEASLDMLVEYDDWHGDGTFRCVSRMFAQMYSIHVRVNGKLFPSAIVLLTAKDQNLYERMLGALKLLRPNIAFKQRISFMSDYELGMRNAMKEVFGLAVKQSYCFFHMMQNVWRKVQSLGLQRAYGDDEELALMVHILPALSFVPSYLVNLGYCDIVADARFTDVIARYPVLVEFVDYFEKTYVGHHSNFAIVADPMFAIDEWNLYDRTLANLPRTNNGVESFHNVFNDFVNVSHPEFLKLGKDINQFIVSEDHERLRRLLANEFEEFRDRRVYRWLNQRVIDGVRRFHHAYNFFVYCSRMGECFRLVRLVV